MNPHTISTLDGIYTRNEHGFYQKFDPDYEPAPETRYPGLIIISLSIIAWAAVGGIGYAV
jgi:hypothetical protein